MTVSRALKTQAQLTPPRYEKRPYAFLHSQTGCEKRGVLQSAQCRETFLTRTAFDAHRTEAPLSHYSNPLSEGRSDFAVALSPGVRKPCQWGPVQ